MVEEQRIDSGIYHWIRHPAYFGGILAVVGIVLSLRSLIAVLLVLIISIFAYGVRISYEEKLLIKEFGEKYLQYRERSFRKLINHKLFLSFGST